MKPTVCSITIGTNASLTTGILAASLNPNDLTVDEELRYRLLDWQAVRRAVRFMLICRRNMTGQAEGDDECVEPSLSDHVIAPLPRRAGMPRFPA